jgi:hypothetical protein
VDPGGGNQNGGSAGSGTTISSLTSISLGVLAGLATFTAAKMLFSA